MTADVAELLRKARSMGADFWLEGGSVVVSAPQPLPRTLMAELRQPCSSLDPNQPPSTRTRRPLASSP